MRYKIL